MNDSKRKTSNTAGKKKITVKDSLNIDSANVHYFSSNHSLTRTNSGDSGFDLVANPTSEVILLPGEIKTIDTGIRLNLPRYYEAQIRPRPGLASKLGVTVLNSPGTINNGYRGEIQVVLINHGKKEVWIKNGDRIAQIVFARIGDIEVIRIDKEPEIQTDTERSDKGLGSSDPKPQSG